MALFDDDSVGPVLILAPALLQDGEGQPIDIHMKSRMDGTYACSYTPVKPIKHTIAVVWGGVNIPHSPYRVGCEVESWPWYGKAQSCGRSGPHPCLMAKADSWEEPILLGGLERWSALKAECSRLPAQEDYPYVNEQCFPESRWRKT